MRVVIWGINYAPEPTGIAPYTSELADFLKTRGMDVEVLTGFPYYPNWKKTSGDRGKLYRSDKVNQVTVHRCWQYVPGKLTTLKRILHEMTFGLTSLLRALFLKRADVYVVVSPPLGLGPCAWLVTRLKRSRYLFHVQDLQPDSAAGLGMVRHGPFLRLMYALERFSYRHAAGVSGISPGMVDAFATKGVPAGKTFLLPNWLRAQSSAAIPAAVTAHFRQRHDVPENALLAIYSGNLGRKQGVEVIFDAAEMLNDMATARPIRLIVAGDGAARVSLEQRLQQRPLSNLRLLPLLPNDEYQVMLRAADLAVITQMPGTGQVCFPSKLLSVLTAELPAITSADDNSDLARAVAEGGFGVNVPASAAALLAEALQKAAAEPDKIREWKTRTGWVNRFSPNAMLLKMELAIVAISAAATGTEETMGRGPERMKSK